MKTINRRTVLRHLATGLGVSALGLPACRRSDFAELIDALAALATDREAAGAIGRAFLDEYPDEERDRMARRLALELDWRSAMPAADLASALLLRIERDFRDAKTVRVNAWVLSQTEARWAALITLA